MGSDAFRAAILPEPTLVFAHNQHAHDPKLGLSVYGPYSGPSGPISIGIIGDSTTVDQVRSLLQLSKGYVEGDPKYPLWKRDFPGMSTRTAWGCELLAKPEWCRTIPATKMSGLEKLEALDEKVAYAVDLFIEEIQKLQEREAAPTIFICAPPREMMDQCVAKKGRRRIARKKVRAKIVPLDDTPEGIKQAKLWDFIQEVRDAEEAEPTEFATENFHHLLKTRAMAIKAVTQFIRPYTLDRIFGNDKKKVQDRATILWNLTVALHYKAGGRPWRLDAVPHGTCFVGIAFYREKFGDGVGTSLAQVFTPEGEGLVLKGERFKWPPYREPHLTKDAARRLVEQVVKSYKAQTDNIPPSRVVVHKTSRFNEDEREGILSALDGVPRRDLVTIWERSRYVKFFRAGVAPPLRGTMVALPDRSRVLYSRGYVPGMRVYPGARVPRPLELLFDQTDSSQDELCREILGLTRLNWNTADFSGMLPMTLQFAKTVGSILRELPPGISPESRYHYYI